MISFSSRRKSTKKRVKPQARLTQCYISWPSIAHLASNASISLRRCPRKTQSSCLLCQIPAWRLPFISLCSLVTKNRQILWSSWSSMHPWITTLDLSEICFPSLSERWTFLNLKSTLTDACSRSDCARLPMFSDSIYLKTMTWRLFHHLLSVKLLKPWRELWLTLKSQSSKLSSKYLTSL